MQFPPGTPLSEVLEVYQQLTKKRLIRDPAVEAKTVGIETSGQLTPAEAIEFIEKSLLLSDVAIVPSGDNMLKVVSTEGAKKPSGEGVPVILRESDLPESDQVVSFVLPLQHLNAEDAAQTFSQIVPPHSYGIVAAIPNARALHITENTSTIRAYIALARQVDVPPNETKHQTIHLLRASAEEVAEQLSNLLGLNQASSATSSGGGSNNRRVNPPLTRPDVPMTPQQAAAQQAAQINITPTVGTATAEAAPPIIQPIARTNSLIVVARPLDIKYIEALVQELDAESPTRGFVSRRLNYMDLTTFITVAEKALMRHSDNARGGIPSSSGSGTNTSTSAVNSGSTTGFGSGGLNSRFGGSNNNNTFGGNDSMGGNGFGTTSGFGTSGGFGSSGSGGGGFGSGVSGGSGAGLEITPKAFSTLVANTLVIVDPASSSFFASGPPEQLRILNELADSLDVRPKQILLTTIIGEFTLGDDFKFGLDWIRTIDNIGNNSLIGGVLQTQGAAYANPSSLGGVEDFLPALDGLTVYGQIGKNLSTFMQTLGTSNRFRLLQRPSITTLNHQTATISTGQQIPYAGSSLTTADNVVSGASIQSTVQFASAELTISITPHIYNDREVLLEFMQQNNNVNGFTTISGNPVPNINSQQLQNRIIVPDRNTVMLGGLITENDTNNKNGLPFLIRVPILKHLFGNTNKNKTRRELMIFIQPRILKDGEEYMTEQSDINRDVISYPDVQSFANPGDGTSLLPLPNWQHERDATPPVKAQDASNPAR
ncbi:secretin N-terminal domain-containing protein [Phragmitibacter flavus]|uniref:secretin N-terminal domain-containing protein n=1 Tax=Phragmitibacter flavus TaxID=2576071 RepID=UPI00140B9B2E|nr:secretin N-terminal domain-containing protein [Phragmitibacter flavus]